MTDADVSTKLDEILRKVDSSKKEIEAAVDSKIARLSEEFAHTSREVQKFKAEKDYNWKREGNKLNFNFNTEVLEKLGQVQWALNYQKVDYASELVGEVTESIQKRNKLIKLADSSEAGWETVRQCVSNDLASDSEDEKRINRAEGRACKKIKAARRSRPYRYRGGGRGNWRDVPAQAAGSANQLPGAYFGVGNSSQQPFQPFRGSFRGGNTRSGSCFHCGDFTHWHRECPYLAVNPRLPRGDRAPAASQ